MRENWLRFWGVTSSRDRLGEAAWDRATRAGAEGSFDEALELAAGLLAKLEELPEPSA